MASEFFDKYISKVLLGESDEVKLVKERVASDTEIARQDVLERKLKTEDIIYKRLETLDPNNPMHAKRIATMDAFLEQLKKDQPRG